MDKEKLQVKLAQKQSLLQDLKARYDELENEKQKIAQEIFRVDGEIRLAQELLKEE